MGFKEKVAKCITELGAEKTIKEMAAGISVRAAADFDKQSKEMLIKLKANMLTYADEVKLSEKRIQDMYNDLMDNIEKRTRAIVKEEVNKSG